jgi:Transglycosylase SLT domain
VKVAGCILTVAVLLGLPHRSEAATLSALVERCAPHVAARSALAVIMVESGGRWWAVNDNDRATPPLATPADAIAYARRRVAEGGSIDIGLTQLNSVHLAAMGVDEAFEPCTNIAMGMAVLQGAWRDASRRWGPTSFALFKAFEGYNGGRGAWDTRSPGLRRKVERYAQTVWMEAARMPVAHSRTMIARAIRGAARSGRPPKAGATRGRVAPGSTSGG